MDETSSINNIMTHFQNTSSYSQTAKGHCENIKYRIIIVQVCKENLSILKLQVISIIIFLHYVFLNCCLKTVYTICLPNQYEHNCVYLKCIRVNTFIKCISRIIEMC